MPGDMCIPAYGWTENRQVSLPQINPGWNDSQHKNSNSNSTYDNNNYKKHPWNNSSHKFFSNQCSSEEPTYLPSNIYQFEVGTPSSSPSSSSTSSLARSNSYLSFYTKSKPYSSGLSSTASSYRSDQVNISRSSSSWVYQGTPHSPNRSCQGSSSSLNTPRIGSASSLCSSGSSSMINKGVDWDRLVDNVFTEEIGLFVQDGGIRNL